MKLISKLWRKLKALLRAGTQLERLEQVITERLERLELLLAAGQVERELAKPALADPKRLERYGLHGLSQFDADGILHEIFQRIGEKHRTFVEFGTGDGQENNTAYLLCQGWRGLWIEGSDDLHAGQQRNFAWAIRAGRLRCVKSFLTRENIDTVVRDAGFSGPIDLLSIDVDGNDYYLWEALTCVEPRVVVVEYNAAAPPPLRWVMAYKAEHQWDMRSNYFGASLASLEALGKRKGLRLVGCDVVGLNAFLVREDLCGDRFAEGDAQRFWHPRRWWLDRAFPSGQVVPYGRPFEER